MRDNKSGRFTYEVWIPHYRNGDKVNQWAVLHFIGAFYSFEGYGETIMLDSEGYGDRTWVLLDMVVAKV